MFDSLATTISQITQNLQSASVLMEASCLRWAKYGIYTFFICEFIWEGVKINNGWSPNFKDLADCLVKWCVFWVIMDNWNTIMQGFSSTVATFAGFSSQNGITQLLVFNSPASVTANPQLLIAALTKAVNPLIMTAGLCFSVTSFLPGPAVFGGIIVGLIGLIVVAFFRIAKELFLSIIIFGLLQSFGPILLPFMACKITEKYFPNMFRSLVNYCIWFSLTMLLLNCFWNVISNYIPIPQAGASTLDLIMAGLSGFFSNWLSYITAVLFVTHFFKPTRDFLYNIIIGQVQPEA